MKRIIFMLLAALTVSTVQAQRPSQFAVVAGDTISTSTSLDTVSKVIPVTAGYSAMGVQVLGTKTSGTITAKAYMYTSLDGTNYVLTDSASAAFANSAGTQSVIFTRTGGIPAGYYKVMVRNVGTTASSEGLAVKVYYVLRKYD